MKLVTFEVPTSLGVFRRLGAWVDGWVVDLNATQGWRLAMAGEPQPSRLADTLVPPEMLPFLEMGPLAMKEARRALDALSDALDREVPGLAGPRGETLRYRPGSGASQGHPSEAESKVRLLAPVPRPPSLRDFYAFEAHVRRAWELRGQDVPPEWYQVPVFYHGNAATVIGPDAEVPWPAFSRQLDYELELACVIGKQGKDIPEEEAEAHIAGYAILNDFSARDAQRQETPVRLGPAKGKGFATGLGPWLVTRDEVGNVYDLRMVARINGEVWSSGHSGSIHWTFAQMIARASAAETLYPGDVIGTGTVGGGCGLELQRWVRPGDVIELEVEKLGVLRNRFERKLQEVARVSAE